MILGIKIYLLLAVVIVFLFFISYRKNKDILKEIKIKKRKILFYSVGILIFEIINHFNKEFFIKTRNKLSIVDCEKESNNKSYLVVIQTIATAVELFSIVFMIGFVQCVGTVCVKQKKIYYITRGKYGEGKKEYVLNASYGGKTEKIKVNVGEKMYSQEETMQIFTDAYPEIIKILIGKNNSTENISHDLNLISKYKSIDIEWKICDASLIDFNGKIIGNEECKSTEIIAVFSLGDFSYEYQIPLVIKNKKQKKQGDSKILETKIGEYINSNNVYSKKVCLPEEIDGKKIVFFKAKDKPNLGLIFISVIVPVIFSYSKKSGLDNEITKRKEQLEMDYVGLVNKLIILQNAGMSMLAAWDKIISDYEKDNKDKRYLYEEMKISRKSIKNGMPETQAYLEFGKRCGIHMYVKLGNLLEQNVRKGTKGLRDILNQEVYEAFEERKAFARKKGDIAGTKMLLPMGIMLVISMIVVIVPAFMSINI